MNRDYEGLFTKTQQGRGNFIRSSQHLEASLSTLSAPKPMGCSWGLGFMDVFFRACFIFASASAENRLSPTRIMVGNGQMLLLSTLLGFGVSLHKTHNSSVRREDLHVFSR